MENELNRMFMWTKMGICMMLMLVIGTSCKNGKEEVAQSVLVNVDVEKLSDEATEFFDSYRSVVLETRDDVLIGDISHIDMDEKHIAIAGGRDVFLFDKDGRFVSKFNRFGQGPNEYIELSDLKLHGNEILILSRPTERVNVYSIDGTFLRSYPLPHQYVDMLIDGECIWLAAGTSADSGYEFSKYDMTTQELVFQVMPYEKEQNCTPSYFTPFIGKSDGHILVAKQFDLTVYDIDNSDGNVCEKYRYHFNTPQQLGDFDLTLPYAEIYQATANKEVVKNLGFVYETSEATYQNVSLFFKLGYFPNIYKFKNDAPAAPGSLLRIGLATYADFPYLRTSPLMIYDGNYVSSMDAYQVLMIAESCGSNEFVERGLTEDSNPVLFFHHFK